MMRPQPARWFEALAARDDAFVLLEALAASGRAEIEWSGGRSTPQAEAANRAFKAYADLARAYRAYWARAQLRPATERGEPVAALEAALARLRAWAAEAASPIEVIQRDEGEAAELALVERVLLEMEASAVDLGQLARAGGGLRSRLLVYPAGSDPVIPPAVLVHRFASGGEVFAVVLGAARAVEQLEREAVVMHGRSVALPGWLESEARASRTRIEARIATLRARASAAREALDACSARHELAFALGDVERAAWCFDKVGAIEHRQSLARIEGWTDDGERLAAAVEASGARGLVSFPPAPPQAQPPLLLRNPWWARPFEIFSRIFGVPGREGVDPSMLLALATPLLFGYMFGDLGQGLVLVAAGLALRRRHPTLRLLVPGGIAAAAFGLAFGSVFGREDLVAAWWIEPLRQPLRVLTVPLFAGAALLVAGLALHALEAWWRRALGEWLANDAGFVAAYLGLLLVPFHAAAGSALAACGAAAFVAGRALRARRWAALASAAGALVERTLQILVNTISFARVGAFALAHAGLGAAVTALAAATGRPAASLAVLAIGNAVVIVLEGMIVAIQTTRLVLFEFFVRFFESRGREFRPLLPPAPMEERP